MTQLDKLDSGQSAIVVGFAKDGPMTRRMMELGLVAGKKVTYIRKAPLRDPILIRVGDGCITLRKTEASLVFVELTGQPVYQ
jgi:Fe2+ transport system protein FeoA